MPKIMSAEFDFKVSTATVVGVKVNLWILTLGGSLEQDHVNDVTFTYARPAPPKQTLSPLSFGPASDFFKKIADLFTKKKQEPPPPRLSDEFWRRFRPRQSPPRMSSRLIMSFSTKRSRCRSDSA